MMYTTRKDNHTKRLNPLKHIVLRSKRRHYAFLLITGVILILSSLVGYAPRAQDLASIDYTPLPGEGWKVSAPEEQGLDPMLVAELYRDAAELENVYGLLLVKNGHLIAEGYFNEGAVERDTLVQSVSKSYIAALVGIALDQGCLTSVDQKMMAFFPEFADQITDPRKAQITIRDLLQMRGGYPWEETDPAFWEALLAGDQLPLLVDYPLLSDPGTAFHYSNLTSYLLGVIVARACDTDLWAYAQEHLLSPMGAGAGQWYPDQYGYYYSLFSFTARDLARFGLLFLDDGWYEGNPVLSADWVRASLQNYSDGIDSGGIVAGKMGYYFSDIGYGYQWWSTTIGDHRFDYAAGHGGQLIILLDEFDLIIVVTSDPFFLQHDDEAWRHERANYNLVGKFIASLGQPASARPTRMPPSVGLHEAALKGDLEAIRQYIEMGSDLNEKDAAGGSSPLIIAATFGRADVARALIDAGADVDHQNNEGSTALHTAALFCHTKIVEALLDKGADKQIRNNTGSTALMAVEGPFEAIKFVYDYFGEVLKPYGLELDYERIERTRPKIAEMLR